MNTPLTLLFKADRGGREGEVLGPVSQMICHSQINKFAIPRVLSHAHASMVLLLISVEMNMSQDDLKLQVAACKMQI